MPLFKNHQKAFTIIELVVVIAIIAVLATIVSVSVSNYIQESKIASAQSEVEQLAKALVMYKAQNSCYPGYEDAPCCTYGECASLSSSTNQSNYTLAGFASLLVAGNFMGSGKLVAKDPWAHPYYYEYWDDGSNICVYVFSWGPDGSNGAAFSSCEDFFDPSSDEIYAVVEYK